MAEAIVGDITPHDNVTDQDKHTLERNAFLHMKNLICSDSNADAELVTTMEEMYTLWQEYENQSSEEAKLVKDIDKFDMILQAEEYETAQGKNLQQFFDSTEGKLKHPFIKALATQLQKERKKE